MWPSGYDDGKRNRFRLTRSDRSRNGTDSASCDQMPGVMMVTDSERRPGARRDAQRNRQRIVEAATRALASGQDPVKIETIAQEAGVGVGTLYRNFPSREALVEEVYRSELTRLCAMAT